MVRKGIYIELIAIVWTVLEAAVAVAAGVEAHSLALVAFGMDSVIELVAGFVLLRRLVIELREKRSERVLRAERAASLVVGIALLLLAVYILVSAFYNFTHQNQAGESRLGIALAVAAGILMPLIAWKKKRIAAAIRSEALKADAACSMVCAYMSWVLIIGVLATAVFHLWWIDSAVSLVLVYFVAREGWEALENTREKNKGCRI
jgi:divalent metal cation (Fe/Co/Zn/Cd) transporter